MNDSPLNLLPEQKWINGHILSESYCKQKDISYIDDKDNILWLMAKYVINRVGRNKEAKIGNVYTSFHKDNQDIINRLNNYIIISEDNHKTSKTYENPIVLSQQWQKTIESENITRSELASREKISRARVTQIINHLKLSEKVKKKILALEDSMNSQIITERKLRGLINLSEKKQMKELNRYFVSDR